MGVVIFGNHVVQHVMSLPSQGVELIPRLVMSLRLGRSPILIFKSLSKSMSK